MANIAAARIKREFKEVVKSEEVCKPFWQLEQFQNNILTQQITEHGSEYLTVCLKAANHCKQLPRPHAVAKLSNWTQNHNKATS